MSQTRKRERGPDKKKIKRKTLAKGMLALCGAQGVPACGKFYGTISYPEGRYAM